MHDSFLSALVGALQRPTLRRLELSGVNQQNSQKSYGSSDDLFSFGATAVEG